MIFTEPKLTSLFIFIYFVLNIDAQLIYFFDNGQNDGINNEVCTRESCNTLLVNKIPNRVNNFF